MIRKDGRRHDENQSQPRRSLSSTAARLPRENDLGFIFLVGINFDDRYGIRTLILAATATVFAFAGTAIRRRLGGSFRMIWVIDKRGWVQASLTRPLPTLIFVETAATVLAIGGAHAAACPVLARERDGAVFLRPRWDGNPHERPCNAPQGQAQREPNQEGLQVGF